MQEKTRKLQSYSPFQHTVGEKATGQLGKQTSDLGNSGVDVVDKVHRFLTIQVDKKYPLIFILSREILEEKDFIM